MPPSSSTPLDSPAPSTQPPGPPLADQVFETLRDWIFSGQLQPGERLLVRELSEKVETSPMPVRNAINRLVEAGLATYEPYKGARVSTMDFSDVEDAYKARIIIEGECARRAAAAADLSVAERMQQHWEMIQLAVNRGDFSQALEGDKALLTELYAVLDNRSILEIISGLWEKCVRYRMVWARQSSNPSDTTRWQYQTQLIEAVRANDGAAAEKIMRETYEQAQDLLRDEISSHIR